ncbi:MAG: alpha/beta fold hydrolase [Lautropia sp.]
MSAIVERSWFGDALRIDWWDQPVSPAGATDPLERLYQASRTRLLGLAEAGGQPVSIVAHSVGAVLAVLLLRSEPAAIRSAVLINPTFDLQRAFVCLARQVCVRGVGSKAGRDVLARMASESCGLLDWAAAFAGVPERFELYWARQSRAARDRYVQAFPSGPPLDLHTFGAVGQAIQDRRHELPGTATTIPVVALIGDQDPMLPDDPVGDVRTRLPRAAVRIVTGGHMAIFEQPPSVWAPSG